MNTDRDLFRMVIEKCGAVLKKVVWSAIGRKDDDSREVFGVKESPDQKIARSILGKDFIGIEEVEKNLGVAFTQIDLAELEKIPFTEETLEACKGTHIPVPGYPLTALDIEEKILRDRYLELSESDLKRMRKELEAVAEEFEKVEKVGARWYLMRKDIVPGSTNKSWEQQIAMLPENEKIPRACELSYTIALYYLARGVCLFKSTYVRCQDDSCGCFHASVGRFYPGGNLFPAHFSRDDDIYETLGIVSLWVDIALGI